MLLLKCAGPTGASFDATRMMVSLFLPVFLAGCCVETSTISSPAARDGYSNIQPNTTTRKQVLQLLGPPTLGDGDTGTVVQYRFDGSSNIRKWGLFRSEYTQANYTQWIIITFDTSKEQAFCQPVISKKTAPMPD